jgi:hypothetical protein
MSDVHILYSKASIIMAIRMIKKVLLCVDPTTFMGQPQPILESKVDSGRPF